MVESDTEGGGRSSEGEGGFGMSSEELLREGGVRFEAREWRDDAGGETWRVSLGSCGRLGGGFEDGLTYCSFSVLGFWPYCLFDF